MKGLEWIMLFGSLGGEQQQHHPLTYFFWRENGFGGKADDSPVLLLLMSPKRSLSALSLGSDCGRRQERHMCMPSSRVHTPQNYIARFAEVQLAALQLGLGLELENKVFSVHLNI